MKYPLMIAALLLLTFSLPALAAIDQEKGYDECLGCHDGKQEIGPRSKPSFSDPDVAYDTLLR